MKVNKTLFMVWATLLPCTQCTENVASFPCEMPAGIKDISYSMEVFPLVSRSCAIPDCHIRGFAKGDFTTYEDLKTRAQDGRLYFRLSSGQMPPASSTAQPLSICELNVISQWIREGAKNN